MEERERERERDSEWKRLSEREKDREGKRKKITYKTRLAIQREGERKWRINGQSPKNS